MFSFCVLQKTNLSKCTSLTFKWYGFIDAVWLLALNEGPSRRATWKSDLVAKNRRASEMYTKSRSYCSQKPTCGRKTDFRKKSRRADRKTIHVGVQNHTSVKPYVLKLRVREVARNACDMLLTHGSEGSKRLKTSWLKVPTEPKWTMQKPPRGSTSPKSITCNVCLMLFCL